MGHPKSFFTLYQPILSAGQRVCQLDRDGSLAAGSPTPEQLAAAVQQACAGAGCVLVPAALVARGGFPLAAFQHVVVYASEAESQVALRPHLAGLVCPLHFLEAALPAPQAAAAPQPGQVRPVAHAPQQQPQGDGAAVAPGVARVQHAARPALVATPVPLPAGSPDWPVIVSSDPCRPIR